MKTIHYILRYTLSTFALMGLMIGINACGKSSPDTITWGSELCLSTQHHERGLPGITVYIKYNQDEFPGYDDLSVFDDSVVSNEFAEACFPKAPPGIHWLVAHGMDSLINEAVKGSVQYEVLRHGFPQDTVLLVGEE